MPRSRGSRVHILAVVTFLLGSVLLLSCQPAQPVATPKLAEKAAVTPTKPAEKAAEKPLKGGTLRVVTALDPISLDANAVQTNVWFPNIHDALIELDKDFNITKGGLFKDWTVSGDGKTITFKLREGVKFHDGTDLDAAAVKFNVERIKDPATKSPFRSYYVAVASMDVVDSTTVRFNLSRVDALLLPTMGTQGGMMVSPAAVKKYGQDYARNPVGSGPFQFVEWATGDHVTLKRFDGYWGKDQDGNKLPYLDQVVFRNIPDQTVAASNLRTGQVEVYSNGPGFPAEQLPALKNDSNLTYTIRPRSLMQGLYLNTKRPPFDNKALRQAVSLALDREGLAAALGEGFTLQASIFHPMNVEWGADPKTGLLPARDLAKAKAKMAEAGYPAGGLKLKSTTDSTKSHYVRMAQVLKANMAEIGIDMEIEVVATAAWASVAQVVGGNSTISTGNTALGLADPGFIFGLMFHSQGGRNYFGPYSNPQADQLIDKAGSIYDQEERTTLYQVAAKIMADDVPYIPAYVENTIAARNKKVRNYVQYPDSLDRLKEVWLAQ